MKEVLSIRLNDQDKEAIMEIKSYLEEQYKDLEPFLRIVTDTDVLKYAIHKTNKILNQEKILKNKIQQKN